MILSPSMKMLGYDDCFCELVLWYANYFGLVSVIFSFHCRVVYYAVSDPSILRFMVEVCWAPMLAAFSVTLDQSDDKEATSQCLQGFRHAVHVTAMMGMQTQRDAFVTTVAKFTNLHCAADMKQKNVDAVKVYLSVSPFWSFLTGTFSCENMHICLFSFCSNKTLPWE